MLASSILKRSVAAQSQTLRRFATQVTTLSNGVRVATDSDSNGANVATVGVIIDAGSANENKKNSGVSGLLKKAALLNNPELDGVATRSGLSLDAYSGREQTVLLADCLKEDAPAAVDALLGALTRAASGGNNLEQLLSGASSSLNYASDSELLFDHLHSVAFQGTALALPAEGTAESLSALSASDVSDYVRSVLTPERVVVCGAGAIDHDALVRAVEQHSQKLGSSSSSSSSSPSKLAPQQDSLRFTGSSVIVQDDYQPQCHFALGFRGAPYGTQDYYTLSLLPSLTGLYDRDIGGGKCVSPRLARIMSEESLAHSLTPFNLGYRNSGIFGVEATAPDNEQIKDLIWEILNNYNRIAQGVTDVELARAKSRMRAHLSRSFSSDGTRTRFDNLAKYVQYKGAANASAVSGKSQWQDVLRQIDAVNVSSLKGVIERYTHDVDVAVAVMGAASEWPDYNILRSWTCWKRL